MLVKDPSVFQMYACGRTKGLVVDIGEHTAGCYPVYEGHILERAAVTGTMATGALLNERLHSCLFDEQFDLAGDLKLDIVRSAKE